MTFPTVEEQQAWRKFYYHRQDPAQFSMGKLLRVLLTQTWQHHCKIIPDYMPPHPREDTKPTCVVQHTTEEGKTYFLRHSNGPLQGFFWDNYGDDMHSPEVALVALTIAPVPPYTHSYPTHGR